MSIAIIVIILILLLTGGLIYLYSRKVFREAKNYERGLKMVTLRIHLPPTSSDTDIGGRDARDVADETISKAQVLYNIISSTNKKGFKSRFYGQRHMAFEIVSSKGLVHFYAAVPVALVSVVKQAVVSAYPTAQLEEVDDHNLFSPVGKISGTIGGELTLKESYVKPIATFKDHKRDTMQSVLNAFSTMGKEDGAAIQILFRPAGSKWTKGSISTANKMRKGKQKSVGSAGFTGSGVKDVLSALWKSPEPSDAEKHEVKQLSGVDLELAESIEEKTKHPGYEVLIRIIASSNTSANSQKLLSNMTAVFALYDAPGKNGFKFTPAKDIESFVTAFIFRFFPPEANRMILNSVELATLFHLPDQSSTPTSQLQRQASKQVDGPVNVPEEGLLLGYNVFRGIKKEIRLSEKDRRRHMYLVGQTGTGKSVVLENMALQDMLDGKGFAFIDPHGDAVENLLNMVPKERTEDVIYFSPADMDYPLGLNLFEFDSPEQKDFLIQEAINMLYKLYDPGHTGIIGPRYEHWFRNAALTLMSDPDGSSFIDIPKVFTDDQYAKQKLKHVTDKTVLEFWNKEMASTSDYHKSEMLGWFVSKFGAFLSNEMMRNVIGQTKSSFNLREVMDEGKILLVNLSKGKTGELNSNLLGMIFVMKFQAAAMSRANIPEDRRRDFSLYVDEFQNFSTDSFATILSEARKYRLSLIVANQFIGQLTEEIRDAIFGNVGSKIILRASANDADFLVKYASPMFESEDIIKLPNYNAVVSLMIGGIPSQPFSMATIPPLGHPNPQLGEALKKLSAAKYGKARAVVEKEIFDRLETKAPAKPAFGSVPKRAAAGAGGSSSSFLDEWLAKRKKAQQGKQANKPTNQPATIVSPTAQPPTSQPTPNPVTAPAPSPVPAPAIAQQPAPLSPPASPTLSGANNVVPQAPPPVPAGINTNRVPPTQAPPQQGAVKANSHQGLEIDDKAILESNIASSDKDKEDINELASLIKDGMSTNSAGQSSMPSSTVGDRLPPSEDTKPVVKDGDDIYIDKDGKIHYPDE